jgi:hypothetical protein
MTAQLNEVVASYSPGRVSLFHLQRWNSRPLARRSTWPFWMAQPKLLCERQGHGFQRTLLISALQLLRSQVRPLVKVSSA